MSERIFSSQSINQSIAQLVEIYFRIGLIIVDIFQRSSSLFIDDFFIDNFFIFGLGAFDSIIPST